MENIWGMGQKPFFSITNGETGIQLHPSYFKVHQATRVKLPKTGLSHFHLPKIGIKHPKNQSSTKKSKQRHLYPEEELWGKRFSIFVHHASVMFNRFPATFPWVSNLSHHLSIIYSSFFHHLLIIFPSSVHHFFHHSPSLFHHPFIIFHHFLHHSSVGLHHFSMFFHRFSIIFPWKNGRQVASRTEEPLQRVPGVPGNALPALPSPPSPVRWPDQNGGGSENGDFIYNVGPPSYKMVYKPHEYYSYRYHKP